MADTKLPTEPRLTSLSHGGGCGCKIAPGVLSGLLKGTKALPVPEELLVGIGSSDDAAVFKISEDQAIVATTDFFMPIVDDPEHFGRIAATNAISDVYAMGGKPLFALAVVGMPVNALSGETIGKILEGGAKAAADAGIPVAGGHTIDSVEPIYGLVAIGIVDPRKMKQNDTAQAGDVLVLGKPLGVGIYSAALKKEALSDTQYDRMIETMTRLNTPGPELAALEGVHGITDVTGFGIAGHALEMARGSGLQAQIDWASVPMLDDVRALAEAGNITGASGRNWASYGEEITLSDSLDEIDRALACDPQTSGGLLVACAPDAVEEVLATFARHGFDAAASVGQMAPGAGVSIA